MLPRALNGLLSSLSTSTERRETEEMEISQPGQPGSGGHEGHPKSLKAPRAAFEAEIQSIFEDSCSVCGKEPGCSWMLCETLKMLHLCLSPCTGALLGAEPLQLQHPATNPASADHDVGVDVRAGVAPGIPRPPPPANARPARPTHRGSAGPARGCGCPRSRRAGRPPQRPLGRARPLPRARHPGPAPPAPGAAPSGGRPPGRVRRSAAPHAFPSSRFADSTRSLRAPRRNACPRKGGEKPKVYQGVRVKITVKELLQQRRAHQAASGGTLSGGNSVHLSDPVPPSSAGQYFEPEPIPSTPNYFQPREFSSCVSCEENPGFLDQIFDSYLQTETHPDPSPSSMQSTPHYFPDSFQPAPFCFNQSLTPGWPSDSSTLSGSLDYSYSPAQLPSYTPENYTSPPSLDTRNCGYPSEDYSYPHLPSHTQYNCFSSATASVCCCASCEAEHLDTFRASECFSYPSTDYVNFTPSAAASSDFCRRETNWDICYS
ncbi:POU class 2 homeobox associating factor 3 [Pseudorca crassidens]|uniref:POU class 2 homeobox associating factor 3 n=1 Tax=Pseudorca crassidens TaxID=82174 RepID=UPI00352D0DDA